MEAASAVALINNLIYKPGWVFHAQVSDRFEDSVRINVNYPAHQSEREDAPEGYPTEITCGANASRVITVGDCDDEMALYKRFVVEVLLKIEEHECREFLRTPPTFAAPFHPHRIGGMRRWGTVTEDLHFGLA
jgi:hypothetical protein